ncbi:MAG: PorT family protein [Saprospiraceae bacterium]|nr:PorT family protein [Saprospiraceae bacterium]MBK6565849.1 PorT family protein [Saprospiraceae bacterium]MBK6784585.1 PorT family protein [Saprospiraceae bacterium]MBK7524929.1 PorT family protein [Saprospiraceae bacterium]MBK8081241.1 PorT family protein [Saprospiraceae bacterium]
MILLFSTSVFAQLGGKDDRYFKDYQKKSYYFGINLGFNNTGFSLARSGFFINNDSIRVTEGENEIGLNMHMVTNLRIGDYFDFRFIPGFSFAQRGLQFTQVEGNIVNTRKIESVFVEIPLQLRYKSMPFKDKRMFMLAGLKYSYDVQTNSKSRKNLLKISPHDFQYEFGFGIQMFYPYFIFSPEIKFSKGLSNLLIYDNSKNESRVLERIRTEIISISFNFEG